MRIVPVLLAGLVLAGCTDADWNRLTRFDTAPEFPPVETPVAAAPVSAANDAISTAAAPTNMAPTVNAKAAGECERTARDRATDAAAQNFDTATQEGAYSVTYAECMKWAARMR